jgi:hypothetical protein
MNLISRMFRKPCTETQTRKVSVDRAYARFMRELTDYWHVIWRADYYAQPLKIDHEAKQ